MSLRVLRLRQMNAGVLGVPHRQPISTQWLHRGYPPVPDAQLCAGICLPATQSSWSWYTSGSAGFLEWYAGTFMAIPFQQSPKVPPQGDSSR